MLNYLRLQTACDLAFATFMVVWLLARHIAYLTVCYSIYIHVANPETGLMPYGCYDTSAGSNGVGVRISAEGGTAVWSNIFQSFTRPDGIVCFNPLIQYGFLALLMALQGLTLLWFGMIVRVAYGVVTGKGAQDSRSDDEVSDVEYDIEVDGEIEGDEGSEEEPDVVDPALEEAPAVLRPMVREKEGSVEAPAVKEARRTSPQPANATGQRRRGRTRGTRASGISIPGHGDHKELLGRIGCDKPS
jgi:very-long-chain ceramide synthase